MIVVILVLTFLSVQPSIGANYNMLVECVENYSNVNEPNLKYTCDAGKAFISKITNAGNYSYRFYSDSAAWPSDWWTKEASGLPYYPGYHAYKHDYAIFLGHGAPALIEFGVRMPARDGTNLSVVWFVSPGPEGYTWIYPHDDDSDGRYPRWITLFSCNVLNASEYPIGYSIFDVFYYTFTNQTNSVEYLHGIVGARTELVDWYKKCLICEDVKVSVNTMNAYADKLIGGESVVDSWFYAVLTENNIRNIFGSIIFQAKPAAVYYMVQFRDSKGNVLASYDYKFEGMLGFSSTIYPAPFQLQPPPGTSEIIYYVVYYYFT